MHNEQVYAPFTGLSERFKSFPFAILIRNRAQPDTWNAHFSNENSSLPAKDAMNIVHLAYDLKNRYETLHSRHKDPVCFPVSSYFQPRETVSVKTPIKGSTDLPHRIFVRLRTPKNEYLCNARRLIEHIHRGDIYEINYCIEFFAENVKIDPLNIFIRLNELTKAPHACLYKNGESWLLCASPERFLKKEGNKLVSQPIKGTRARGKTREEDEQLINDLRNDPKEISENVMIVDLVRNDLSRIAEKNSVKVEELCGIHTFESVHQMISTVCANVNEKTGFEDIIRSAFPMGSMTGAPKVRAMQLIDEFEDMNRGIYSGSVGILQANGDFDLNVVIRSIEYNAATGYLSIKAGSALTANCDPEKEYEECLLKAHSMLSALNAVIE